MFSACRFILVICCAFLICLQCSPSSARGQEVPGSPSSAQGQVVPQISVEGHGSKKDDPIGMGEKVTLKVTGLDALFDKDKVKREISNIIVYLNNMPLKNTLIKTSVGDQLSFWLQPTSDSKAAWSDLFGRPDFSTRMYTVSVGLINAPQLPNQEIYVRVISPVWFGSYIVVLVVLLILFGSVASRSNIIRDSTTLPTSAAGYKPYSLAKLQMAVWFFLILAAFLFIWMITGQYDSITPQVLGLMGIASGTALGAAVIDDNKNQSAANQLTEMRPRCDALWAEIPELTRKVAEFQTKVSANTPVDPRDLDALKESKAELEGKKSLWNELDLKMKDVQSRTSATNSTNFLDDLLSDANGYSFHRFQICAWTIVLGALFVRAVWAEFAMPQFSETLLALMGVSGFTYLGFKFPERPSDPSVPRPVVPSPAVPAR
jgi:hypothetical protein